MSDITLNTQSITGNHNFVPPGTDWNLGSGSKKWNGGYFGTIIADNGIPAGTAATGGDKIGQIRFSINPNIEPGYLALNGQEVNREDYPNLWEWVQQQVGFLVEEGEWQSISTAHNGNVGKYSVGNGTSTFRLPNLGCWVKGGGTAGTATGVGGNLDAGLPNIEGGYTGTQDDYDMFVWQARQEPENRGALSSVLDSVYQSGVEFGGSGKFYSVRFDASDSNPIYGNAETVQPESIVGIWLVKAYHVPVDNMGNTITVNGVPPDENGNIDIEVPQSTIATQEEAEVGTDNTKVMTPLRTKQVIAAQAQGVPIGDVVYRPYLMAGYVKANGATVNRSDYPTLVQYANDNNLWTGSPTSEPWKFGVGDGSSTMVLPDYRNRFIEGGNNVGITAAGLPNITGDVGIHGWILKPTGAFKVSSNEDKAAYVAAETAPTINFAASRSNVIYGNSNTVQPPSIVLIPQIKY